MCFVNITSGTQQGYESILYKRTHTGISGHFLKEKWYLKRQNIIKGKWGEAWKNRSDSYESLLSSCTWRDLNPHPSNMDMNLNHARMPIPPQVPDSVPLSQALNHNNTDCWFCQAKNVKTNVIIQHPRLGMPRIIRLMEGMKGRKRWAWLWLRPVWKWFIIISRYIHGSAIQVTRV